MNSTPIVPAVLAFDAQGVPFSPRYGDIYHPRSGALAQARHVFIRGHGLPERWRGRERFVVLETGFGLGNNFLATWQAWRDDPGRCERLVFISIEQHPPTGDDLLAVHRDSPIAERAAALHAAWPPLTHNLHRLAFEGGRVELLLALGDVQAWLPELVAEVDAFDLDGFAPARNPRMWDARVCKALGRLAAPGATLATWSAAKALRADLASAGFEVRLAPGQGGKRDITLARYAPRFVPRRSRARPVTPDDRHALIVGAGLAGCSAAAALAEQGWRSTLIERGDAPAREASGNPAGLFHGIVNAQDGVHARFNRAAALAAAEAVRAAIADGVAGHAHGLLRLERSLDAAAMRAQLDRLGLPPDYVQALPADAASERAGLPLAQPCWFYPRGGWVAPAGLAAHFLRRAGALATSSFGREVARIERRGNGWCALDADGALIAEASTLVLANANGALGLLGRTDWPIECIRGQLSIGPADALALPVIPVAGSGYLMPRIGDCVVFGATAQVGDLDPPVREADHLHNLAQLERLTGAPAALTAAQLVGRVGWRCSAVDRLPLIGAAPDPSALEARMDAPRFVPRLPGLHLFTALGSRGITWSALGARILAAGITGAPAPVEASLLDAVDPARFVSRRARRGAG